MCANDHAFKKYVRTRSVNSRLTETSEACKPRPPRHDTHMDFSLHGLFVQPCDDGPRFACVGKFPKTEELMKMLGQEREEDARTSYFFGNCGQSNGR